MWGQSIKENFTGSYKVPSLYKVKRINIQGVKVNLTKFINVWSIKETITEFYRYFDKDPSGKNKNDK